MIDFLKRYNEENKSNSPKHIIKGILIFTLLYSGVLFFSLNAIANDIPSPPNPIIITPENRQTLNTSKPLIIGLTKNNTQVDVYIDGVFDGNAKVNNSESGTANFSYHPFLNISEGHHVVYTIARTKTDPQKKSPQSPVIKFIVTGPAAPTLVEPVVNHATTWDKPHIVGLTPNNTNVFIYIDGKYVGETKSRNHSSGTANFVFTPKESLSFGMHTVSAKTINAEKLESAFSKELNFYVQPTYAPAILYQPVVNDTTTYNQPYIVGLAKNNSKVEFIIDGNIDGEITVKNHASGTANFAYLPSIILKDGKHNVTAIAHDPTGRKSLSSNTIYFTIGTITEPVINATEPQSDKTENIVIDTVGDGTVIEGDTIEDDTTIEPPITEEGAEDISATSTEAEPEDYSIAILVILTIVVIVFLIWFIWANKDFFQKTAKEFITEDEDNAKGKEKPKNTNDKEPPSLF